MYDPARCGKVTERSEAAHTDNDLFARGDHCGPRIRFPRSKIACAGLPPLTIIRLVIPPVTTCETGQACSGRIVGRQLNHAEIKFGFLPHYRFRARLVSHPVVDTVRAVHPETRQANSARCQH